MAEPGFMIAAAGSGSGKTFITCGLLRLLSRKGLRVHSFKCGPDYIDPMFHTRILGISSHNLDPYFTAPEMLRYLYGKGSGERDLAVVEGVMGYYDGIGGASETGSSYELALVLGLPVVLVVSCRGMSVSAAAIVKGFLEFKQPSQIAGVILNQISEKVYAGVRQVVEESCGIPVLGYVPVKKAFAVESRHLGLVTPDQVQDLQARVDGLADVLEETLDLPRLLELAGSGGTAAGGNLAGCGGTAAGANLAGSGGTVAGKGPAGIWSWDRSLPPTRVAVARDEAFCFFYQDNLDLLQALGAQLLFFSPLRDRELPKGAQALLLPGGYPELYARPLSENRAMLESVRRAVMGGMPTVAECGGFLYLHEALEDDKGQFWQMAGVIPAKAFRTGRLGRFGYIEVTAKKDQLLLAAGDSIRSHEFHYWDSESCGTDCHARKASRQQEWDCVHGSDTLYAGFPHIYFYAHPESAVRLLQKAAEYGK